MRRSPQQAIVAGAPAGLAIVALATAGHALAGGTISPSALAVLTALVVLVTTVLASRVRWTPMVTLALAALAQPVLHLALGAGSEAGAPHADHAHHAMGHSAGSVSVSMAVMHAVVAVVSTAALTFGVRWLRTMPALLRAMLIGVEQSFAAFQAPTIAVRPSLVVGAPSLVLASRSSRGPPE